MMPNCCGYVGYAVEMENMHHNNQLFTSILSLFHVIMSLIHHWSCTSLS